MLMALKNFITLIHFKLCLNEKELKLIIGRFCIALLKLKDEQRYCEFFKERNLVSTKFMDESTKLTDLITIMGIWSNERKSRMSIELQVSQ